MRTGSAGWNCGAVACTSYVPSGSGKWNSPLASGWIVPASLCFSFQTWTTACATGAPLAMTRPPRVPGGGGAGFLAAFSSQEMMETTPMTMRRRAKDMRATSSHGRRCVALRPRLAAHPPARRGGAAPAQRFVEEAVPAQAGVVVDHRGVAAAAHAVLVRHHATSFLAARGGQARGPALPEAAYRVTVQSVLPLLSIATIERVAVPPDVVAGTVTNKYVPPLNGVSSVTMPLNDFVQAVAPLAVEIAVTALVRVPSELRVSTTVSRLPSESSTPRAPAGRVAVQAVAPLERMALTVTVVVPFAVVAEVR